MRVIAGLAILVPDWLIGGTGLAATIALIIGHRYLNGEPSKVDARPT